MSSIVWRGKILLMNAERSMHRMARHSYVKDVRAAGKLLAMEARLPRPFDARVDIVVRHFYRGPAPDSVACYPCVKALVDGLTDYGCWPDDSAEHVGRMIFEPPVHDKGNPRAEIEIRNAPRMEDPRAMSEPPRETLPSGSPDPLVIWVCACGEKTDESRLKQCVSIRLGGGWLGCPQCESPKSSMRRVLRDNAKA